MEGEREKEKKERGEMIEAKPTFPVSLTNTHTNLDSTLVAIPISSFLIWEFGGDIKNWIFFFKTKYKRYSFEFTKVCIWISKNKHELTCLDKIEISADTLSLALTDAVNCKNKYQFLYLYSNHS